MSTSIYNPYFYIIQHISSGKYYAGVKYGIGSNPNQLLKSNGYQTSSDIIKQIILEEGIESFLIRKIKVFENASQALAYELRFLKRVNAAFNDNFLNRSNSSFRALNADYEKRKQTCLKKFGCEYALQSEDVKEKGKQTNLDNLGVENPSQSNNIKEKKKQTCLDNYGVEHPGQSEYVKEKSKHTCLEKFGCEFAFQSEEVKEKIKNTNLERCGFENPMQSPELQEKSKQTNLEKYGVEHPMQSEEIKERHKQTCLDNYGTENPSQSPEVKEKVRQTRNNLLNRPIVSEIRKYRDKFKLKLGSSWFWKKQETLDIILEELKMTYGELI